MTADALHEVDRDLVEEPRRWVVVGGAEQTAAPCVRHVQSLPGPSDADVGQPALLLHLIGLGEGTDVREDTFLDADDEDVRELEALGGVQCHQQHPRVVAVDLVGVGDQRHLLDELFDGGELPGRTDQLAEVLQPPRCFDRAFRLELAQVPAAIDRRLQELGRSIGDEWRETVEQLHEPFDAPHRSARDARVLGVAERLDERLPVRCRPRVEPADRGVADAALRFVEDALDAHLVERVDDRPEIGERVLDLLAVVETGAADHLVGDTGAHEGFFDDPALRVRPVEDGDVAPPLAVGVVEVGCGAGHPRGFVRLVLGLVARDPVTLAVVAPEHLRLAAGVVVDDSVGGVEDGLRRPVVLVEHDGGDVGERFLELQDVPQVRAAELVDAVVHQQVVGDIAVGVSDFEVEDLAPVLLDLDRLDERGDEIVADTRPTRSSPRAGVKGA